MPNPEHVGLVKQGANAIAAWRKDHPNERLDLHGAFLWRAQLRQADLSGADLICANLIRTRLSRANLRDAELHWSHLIRAKLDEADLTGADLRDVNLRRAKLCKGDLTGASLKAANLVRANLAAAKLANADLQCADLAGADLFGTVMWHANLRGAELRHADLRYASLYEADLTGADLSGADLSHSNISSATLVGTSLTAANLVCARLTGAYLSGVGLGEARLHKASIGRTTFAHVDLSEVQGLESVSHCAPSAIDAGTLCRSRGRIPVVFLRGCRVPDGLIERLRGRSDPMDPIECDSCFVCHGRKDEKFCHQVRARLRQEELPIGYVPGGMRGSRKAKKQIDEAIRVYDRLLLVLSDNSMESEWVRHGIEKARQKEADTGRQLLFPIALVPLQRIRAWGSLDVNAEHTPAKKGREYRIPDFSNWKYDNAFESAFADLMRDLRAQDQDTGER